VRAEAAESCDGEDADRDDEEAEPHHPIVGSASSPPVEAK
jgi:hypothetical protein